MQILEDELQQIQKLEEEKEQGERKMLACVFLHILKGVVSQT